MDPSGDQYTVPPEDTHACDDSHLQDQEDIASMNNMHEGGWVCCSEPETILASHLSYSHPNRSLVALAQAAIHE